MTPRDAVSILPKKTFDVEFKDLEDTGEFSLYAAIFNNVDRQNDVIDQGAFDNLDEFMRDGWIALSHDQKALPIGIVKNAIQDNTGLHVLGTWHSTPEAQACRTVVKERMAAGKGVKCSIGYVVPVGGEEYEKRDGRTVRRISKLSVYEASIVWLPANPLAEVQWSKSFEGFDPESEEEMSDQAVVRALKRVLGLKVKSSYKVDGEDMEKAKAVSEKCAMHAKAAATHYKAAKESSEACSSAHDELTKCFKSFTSGQQDEPEAGDDNEGDDVEKEKDEPDEDAEDEEQEKPKPKAKKEEDSEDEKTKKAYREQLRKRSLMTRREQVCP